MSDDREFLGVGEALTPIRMITKHPGNRERVELGACTRYIPKGSQEYKVLYNTIPFIFGWCAACGEPRECSECMYFSETGCDGIFVDRRDIVEKILIAYQEQGYPWTEDDGEIIIDITGHDPVFCEDHPENGCIICYGCTEPHEEE